MANIREKIQKCTSTPHERIKTEHGERTRTHLPKDAVLQAGGEDVNAVLLGILREPGLAGLVRSSLNGNEESDHREDGYEETEEGRHGQALAGRQHNGVMQDASKSFLGFFCVILFRQAPSSHFHQHTTARWRLELERTGLAVCHPAPHRHRNRHRRCARWPLHESIWWHRRCAGGWSFSVHGWIVDARAGRKIAQRWRSRRGNLVFVITNNNFVFNFTFFFLRGDCTHL